MKMCISCFRTNSRWSPSLEFLLELSRLRAWPSQSQPLFNAVLHRATAEWCIVGAKSYHRHLDLGLGIPTCDTRAPSPLPSSCSQGAPGAISMAGMAIPCHSAPARQMTRIMAMPARVQLPSLGPKSWLKICWILLKYCLRSSEPHI